MTPPQKNVIIYIRTHGPATTKQLIRAGLSPRAANALRAEDKLTIGQYGYELPSGPVTTECGCGCGGVPNVRHEADLVRKYYATWPREPLTPWLRTQLWCTHIGLVPILGVPVFQGEVPDSVCKAADPVEKGPKTARSRHSAKQLTPKEREKQRKLVLQKREREKKASQVPPAKLKTVKKSTRPRMNNVKHQDHHSLTIPIKNR